MKVESIIKENKRRIQELNQPYDPFTGIDSPIERKKLVIDELGEFYLPLPFFDTDFGCLLEHYGSIQKFAEQEPYIGGVNAVTRLYLETRCKYDFEFWAAYAVKIKPKEGGDYIPFILNAPQRKLHKIINDKILANEPIRIILVKSRQWGGSTTIQNEMAHIQLFHKTNWNSLIAAHIKQAASNIRSMFSIIQKKYPASLDQFTLQGFEQQSNVKYIPERNNKITIGSIESPDSIRSDDVAMAHLSEAGLWRKTEGKSPEDLCQSILGTIPRKPYTLYALESTAKGVGNFFHRTWQGANAKGKDNNGLTPVFVSWMEDKNNQESFKSDRDKIEFVKSWSEYEKYLWKLGATIEGISFYRNKLKEMNNDEWRMKSEFPSTADEAFQSSGQRVFAPQYVINIRKNCQSPEYIGDIFGASHRGKEALNNIVFNEQKDGNLSVWIKPQPYIEIKGKKYRVANRYCGFADIGGRTRKADYSELTIIDRIFMMEGGLPEVAAQWSGHLDQDLFAWKCAMIGMWYEKMLLAIETNSLKTKETEGDHFYTVLDEIAPYYPNLYSREIKENIANTFVMKWGFQTNVQSKGMIMDNLNGLLRESGYIEREAQACDQMDYYEVKENGSLGAVDGEHDDKVITRAGALWLATKFMPPPKLVPILTEQEARAKYGNTQNISEITF